MGIGQIIADNKRRAYQQAKKAWNKLNRKEKEAISKWQRKP